MPKSSNPSMFGIENSNRDFTNPESWGKNQFNSSFPASLISYMGIKNISPVYIELDQNIKISHKKISATEVLGLKPLSPNLYFGFEENFTPYIPLVIGSLPRIDLVTIDTSKNKNICLRGLEIKLTALPDHQTCNLKEDKYGCEIVVRPDTVIYLALSIANQFKNRQKELYEYFESIIKAKINWESIEDIKPLLPNMTDIIDNLIINNLHMQKPFMLQPVWKTKGKFLRLSENCFDVFVWSNFSFTRLFIDPTRNHKNSNNITRHMRTTVWLTKMLSDFAERGKIRFRWVIDHLTYNTKNDKAFASGGTVTFPYMNCDELVKPRIKKQEIKNIILGGGERYLSPERRLDAAILSTPGIF